MEGTNKACVNLNLISHLPSCLLRNTIYLASKEIVTSEKTFSYIGTLLAAVVGVESYAHHRRDQNGIACTIATANEDYSLKTPSL